MKHQNRKEQLKETLPEPDSRAGFEDAVFSNMPGLALQYLMFLFDQKDEEIAALTKRIDELSTPAPTSRRREKAEEKIEESAA